MSNWKNDYRNLSINELSLDLQNPRIDSGEKLTETDVVRELLDENVMELASDIVQNGYAPTSILMVVEEDGKKIVIEGNRRLMALKLINDPKVIEGIGLSRDFKKAQEFNTHQKEDLSNATSIIYPNREDAERDMAKLHLAGIAIQQWRPIRQYRYFQKRLDESELSIDTLSDLLAIDKTTIKRGIKTYQLFKVAKADLSEIVKEIGIDIFSDKYFKTDKFQRAIVNSEGERFLGYSFNEPTQEILIENKRLFLDRLGQVLLELYDSSPRYLSGAQFSAKERDLFFKSIDPKFLSDPEFRKAKKVQKDLEDSRQVKLFEKKEQVEVSTEVIVESGGKIEPVTVLVSTSSSNIERGTKVKPDWVVDADVRFYNGADRVKDILNELKKNIPQRGENLNIVVVALRVVVELAIYNKLKDNGMLATIISNEKARINVENAKRVSASKGQGLLTIKPNWAPTLKQMLSYMIDEANSVITDPEERKALKLVIDKGGVFIDDLDNFVHNVSYHPTDTVAKDIWKVFGRPIFDIIKKI